MNKSDLILRIANVPDGDIALERVEAALAGNAGNRDEVLTAKESCDFLRISRSTLWRKFPPSLKIGSLPRWTKSALLKGDA